MPPRVNLALDYDRQCDAALPLETVLRPDPNMQALLRDIDRTKFQVWALTNAYYNVSATDDSEIGPAL